MYRNTFVILTFATTLLASTAEAYPQSSTGGGSGGARTTVRARCSSCPASRDSIRRHREKLLLRIDSLRWEIDNRRLSDVERNEAARELSSTILALQSSLDDTRGIALAARAAEAATTTSAVAAPHEGAVGVEVTTARRAFAVAPMPRRTRGYLGVTFDGPSAECDRCTEHVIRFFQYPKIAMVEPGSPAERAGVLEGDTLLALNGTDVIKNEISLTKLLIPDARIVMRVRRDDNQKDIKVTVGETPDYYVRRALPRSPTPAMPPVPSQSPERVRVYGLPPQAPQEMQPPLPGPPATGFMWVYNEGVAGARVETINEGLGKTIGVKEGVLVIRASPGTPAHRSGLRDGDVILSADGRQLVRVNELRSIVARGDGEEGVKLTILRDRKKRDVTLRW